jgi:transcriptional regulator with XRE-family HTH domain
LEYENFAETVEALRMRIKATGIDATERASGVSRSQIQAIVNDGAAPHPKTLAKLEAALERL